MDATGLGGDFATVSVVPGGPPGYLALRLDKKTVGARDDILAAPMVAIGVYDDADQLIDATSVQSP